MARGKGRWAEVRVVESTGSTNADLVAAAGAGEPSGTVLVAEEQTAGRGRLDRQWSSPPRSGLTFSMLLAPDWPAMQWGWVPLAAGVALAEVVRECGLVEVGIKWPNDLLVGNRKCAGILSEVAAGRVVVGVGLNVTTTADELPSLPPGQQPTSLVIEGAVATDRATLLLSMLRHFDHLLSGGVDTVRERLLEVCFTVGSEVRVELPGGESIEGLAVDVDHEGRLVVETGDGRSTFAAGDIRHLRRAP